jgi:hypothetical protein
MTTATANEYLQPGSMIAREGYGHVDCGIFSEVEARKFFDECVCMCIDIYNAQNPRTPIKGFPKIIFSYNKNAGHAYFHIDNYDVWHLLVNLDYDGKTPKIEVVDEKAASAIPKPELETSEIVLDKNDDFTTNWEKLTDNELAWDLYEFSLEGCVMEIDKQPEYKAPGRKLNKDEHRSLINKRMTDAKFNYYNTMKQKKDQRYINMEIKDVFKIKLSPEMEKHIMENTSDYLSIKISAALVSSNERKVEVNGNKLFAVVPYDAIPDVKRIFQLHNTSSVKYPEIVVLGKQPRPDGTIPINVCFDRHTRDARFSLLTHTVCDLIGNNGRVYKNVKFMKSKEKTDF